MLGILSEDPPKLLHALPRMITPKGVGTQKRPHAAGTTVPGNMNMGNPGTSRGARKTGTTVGLK